METATAVQLLDQFRTSGLWTEDQIIAADAVAAAAPDFVALADQLWPLGCLTKYQYVKVRNGRIDDLVYGPYLVLDKVGEGGMGKVFKAVETGTGRFVALKTIRPQLMANKTVVKRYEREAKAARALNHPNVVAMFDAAEVGGRFIMAMEFVEGVDLSRLVKEYGRPPDFGMPDPQEVCEYVRQAALGLHAAHALGFVHRDIKPSNILVSGERSLAGTNGSATVKVLDMGLVRQVLESEDASRTELTRDGTVVGTPDYMAPEQAKNSSTVDHRADLYALGCTLFFLLRGQPPFPEGSPLDKLIRHQIDPPPDLRPLRPDVPEAVHRVVERLLRKKPAERYDSAADVAAALAPFTPGGAGGAALPPPPAVQTFLPVSLAPDVPADATPHGPAAPPPSGATPKETRKKVVLRPVSPPPMATVAHPTPAAGTPRGPRLVPVGPPPKSGGKRPPAYGPVTPVTDSPSGSISGPLTDKLTRTATPVSTPKRPAPPSQAHRRPRRGRGKDEGLNPLFVAAGVVGALAVLLLVYLILKPSGATTRATRDAGPDQAPPPASRYAHLPPAGQVLAPATVAALVVYPRALWEAGRPPPPAADAQLTGLAKRTRFDTRRFDRVCVSFSAKAGTYAAVGEGPTPAAEWEKEAEQWVGVKPVAVPGGKLYKLDGPADPRALAVAPKAGYALADDAGRLTEWLGGLAKPASAVPRELADALPKPAENDPPVATFAATGLWSLPVPGANTLTHEGVRLATAEAWWADGKFDLTLTLTGPDEATLKAFVSEELSRLGARYSSLGKVLGPLIDVKKPLVEPADDGVRLRYRKSFDWSAVSLAVEHLMPEAVKK